MDSENRLHELKVGDIIEYKFILFQKKISWKQVKRPKIYVLEEIGNYICTVYFGTLAVVWYLGILLF